MTLTSQELIQHSLFEAQMLLTVFMEAEDNLDEMAKIAKIIQSVFEKKGRVFVCGNGGRR